MTPVKFDSDTDAILGDLVNVKITSFNLQWFIWDS